MDFSQKNEELTAENTLLKDKLEQITNEVQEMRNSEDLLISQNKMLKIEVQSAEERVEAMSENTAEEQESSEHVKSILVNFLKNTPFTSKDNEAMLPVVFSMMKFSKKDMQKVVEGRTAVSDSAKV